MSTQDKGLSRRTHKREGPCLIAYLWAVPPMILLFLYRIVPFISGLSLPFAQSASAMGTGPRIWVGMNNFRELFNSFSFSKVLGNTIILKLEYILLCSFLALLLVLVLGSTQSKFWQRFFSAAFLFPYFIPTAVISYLILYTMGNAGMFFTFSMESMTDPRIFRLIYPVLEVIKNLGIPIIIALGAINAKRESGQGTGGFIHMQLLPALKAIGLFVLIELSALLSSDFELLTIFHNPEAYGAADVIDTFTYRNGIVNMDTGVASSAWLVKFLIQTVISILIFLGIRKFSVQNIFTRHGSKNNKGGRLGSFVVVIAGLFILEIYLLLTAGPMAVSAVETFKGSAGALNGLKDASSALIPALSYKSIIGHLLLISLAVVINAIVTILLTYPLTVKDLPGRLLYSVSLIFILNIGVGGIHEFLFFKGRGIFGTVFPYIITGSFTLINVFVLRAVYNARYKDAKEEAAKGAKGEMSSFFKGFLPRVIKPVLGLSALQYAIMWNSYYPRQLMYISDPAKFSPVMTFRNLVLGGQAEIYEFLTPEIIKLAAMVSIPGIIILLLLMIFGGEELFASQIRKS
ncbi:MAG TPA: hypothetical protein VFD89_05675 [Clostridia bacterium]|nr:hypothetical protein [Clostridia bacterium]